LREKGEVLGTVEVVEGLNNAAYTVEEGTNQKKRLRKSS
jgi:hypothetical protein